MKKVVVSGGSGFVASWVIADFLNHGYAVTTSLRSLTKADGIKRALARYVPATALANLTFFAADLTQPDGWAAGMAGADGVIHVASPLGHGTESTDELVRIARDGVQNVFQAAVTAGITRIVMTSSQAASTPDSQVTGTLTEDFWTDPQNPELDAYRISKVTAERTAWELAAAHHLDLTTILPGAIFGPVMTQNLSSNAYTSYLTTKRARELIPDSFFNRLNRRWPGNFKAKVVVAVTSNVVRSFHIGTPTIDSPDSANGAVNRQNCPARHRQLLLVRRIF